MIGRLGLIKAEDLAAILVDDEGSEKIPLPSFPKISDSAKFIPNVDLVLFIPGWTQNDGAFDNVTQVLVNAFGQRYDRVFAVSSLRILNLAHLPGTIPATGDGFGRILE